MTNIFVDPVIVTTPPDEETREGIEAYLNNLNIWLKEALTAPYSWLHSVQVTDILQDSRRFPSFELLRNWQRKYRLDINVSQGVRRVNEFFRDESLDLGSNLEKLGYLIEPEEGSIVIQPGAFPARWHASIRDDMHMLLATTCACKYTGDSFARELRIATLILDNPAREIEVSVTILASIPDFERDANNKISQKFPLLFTPDDLLPFINVIELWSTGEKGIRYAIEQQYKKDWQAPVAQPLKFHLGSRFIESVNNAGLDTNEVVLSKIVRAAAAIIADKAKDLNYNLRHLREGETAGSPQRARLSDNAKAWRLTLIERGAGWRMHYWQISAPQGSIIEFANVLKKHDPEEIY